MREDIRRLYELAKDSQMLFNGSPYLRQDIDTLEQVQRRATKMIRWLGKFTYEERLMRCGLTNLEKRRTRGDLIEAYKIMTGKEAISAHKFFEVSMESRTRGHGYKLYKKTNWDPEEYIFQCEGCKSMERTEWEDCYSGHGGQIQETPEWIWILRYGSGSDTDSSLLNHSKLLLCYVTLYVN